MTNLGFRRTVTREKFLQTVIDKLETSGTILSMHKDEKGEVLNFEHTKDDQMRLCIKIFETIIQFMKDPKNFKPLHAIIMGEAGSGKTFVEKVIANTIRQIFGSNSVCSIFAPTGAAAHSAGGETLHRGGGVHPFVSDKPLSKSKRKQMIETFKRCLILIIDERSMVSFKNLGEFERNVSLTAHGGERQNERWGGIPIVILVGDDYQIPSIRDKGAIYIMDKFLKAAYKGL